ncbi:MAG: DUF937 domain-containing protein [Candidatus Binatia bacterium]
MSNSVLDLINQQVSGSEVKQMSRQIGADEEKVSNAVNAALPILLGGLARNSENPQGAESLSAALSRDHDGGILDDVQGFLGRGNISTGQSILDHIFGGKSDAMASVLGRVSGLDANSAGNLLALLAPIVMGALGKFQRQTGVDAGGLSNVLSEERARLEQSTSGLGGLARLLDFDGDGQIIDDIGKIVSVLGNMFRR